MYVCVTTQQRNIREKFVTLKIIIHGYNYWNFPDSFGYYKNITQKVRC